MDLNLFKNKEELKKFLENLGTEYRYGCYSENNPTSCHLLGDYFYSIDKDLEKAAATYAKNCDESDHGLSCDAFGRLAYKGQGMPGGAKDISLALKYFTKGCDLGEPRACYHGGQMYGVKDREVNKVITPDPEKAIAMLDKCCDSKREPDSCFIIQSMYLSGTFGLQKDLKKAAEYAQKACDQDHYGGCFNLSRMYHLGDGVEPSKEKSQQYFARGKQIIDGKKETINAKTPSSPDL